MIFYGNHRGSLEDDKINFSPHPAHLPRERISWVISDKQPGDHCTPQHLQLSTPSSPLGPLLPISLHPPSDWLELASRPRPHCQLINLRFQLPARFLRLLLFKLLAHNFIPLLHICLFNIKTRTQQPAFSLTIKSACFLSLLLLFSISILKLKFHSKSFACFRSNF